VTDDTFSAFRRRLVRSYVLLAAALIVAVAATTTVLAFASYVGNVEDAVAQAARRAGEIAATLTAHQSLAAAAPAIVHGVARGPVRALVFDQAHHLLAGTPTGETALGRAVNAIAEALGMRPQRVSVNGGTIVVEPDIARFARFLGGYWSIVLPVGILAIIAAWLLGRVITARAIAPLTDVTGALHRIAEGNFEPEPLTQESGALQALTAAYNDVARRLTVATAERRANELRMRQFIADAGHELRTPLTIIMGYLDVLIAGIVRDPDGIARVHNTMLDESRRMRALIDKLIYLARLERPETPSVTRFDLSASAREVARALEPIAGGRIEVSAAGPVYVEGDEAELAEAIKNVTENAIKYAPESPVRLAVSSSDGHARVQVADEGPGMDERDVMHAFDRFYRGESRTAVEGSGLGLAIAQRAVERAGGSIAIRSAPGSGTLVSFVLPEGDSRAQPAP
jgi:signal transduction histidine kinase